VKIDNSIKTTSGNSVKGTSQPRTAGAPAAPQQGTGQESVKITPLSAQLHALESSLNSVSVVDTARVESIKQAISEGRFQVRSEVVADRLIAAVKELVLHQKL
jgi:negative regulator of flagellin synthesis FlgM